MRRAITITQHATHGNRELERVLRALVDNLKSYYPGNIYYAVDSTADYYDTFVEDYQETYSDNSQAVHTTIQSAVDGCAEGRADVVFVMPKKWKENVLLFEKATTSVVAVVEGWETQIRASDGDPKYPCTPVGGSAVSGFCFVVISRSVTVEGFCLDADGGYGGIYVGDGYRIDTDYGENSASARLRRNHFRSGIYGLVLDGCSDNVIAEDNTFQQQTTAGVYICPGGDRTVQRPIIRRNEFIDVAGYGIDMYSDASTVGILVRENAFCDGVSTTMTAPCRFQGAGVHAFVGNYCACANDPVGSSTDFMSANGDGFPMNAVVHLDED